MKFLIVFALIFATSYATSIKPRELIEPLSQDHVDYINSLNTTWKAGHNFRGLKIKDLKAFCGTILDKNDKNKKIFPADDINTNKLPEEFDSRKKWPECADVISHVRDQAACGSCWAVSVASAITDRVCIASGGKNKTQLSAQEITSCCTDCGNGCFGGYPGSAFDYWVEQGLVSGGDYGDKNTCYPYSLPPCEHHVDGPLPKCGDIQPTPTCSKKCVNKKLNYEQDKNFGISSFSLENDIESIKTELSKRGPLAAAFFVYDDFFLYKEGVYQVTPGAKFVGGHAISVLGWGVSDGVEYWLAKNNWNSDWGDKGYFKIKMGEANINSGFTGGIANK